MLWDKLGMISLQYIISLYVLVEIKTSSPLEKEHIALIYYAYPKSIKNSSSREFVFRLSSARFLELYAINIVSDLVLINFEGII